MRESKKRSWVFLNLPLFFFFGILLFGHKWRKRESERGRMGGIIHAFAAAREEKLPDGRRDRE
jgi:hypothetical protein